MTFEFEERQGNLIDSVMPTDSIVLVMTEDMKLLNKDIRSRLSQPQQLQKKKVGQVAIHQHQKRFIFYLITRQKSYNKPTYAQLEACLIELRKTCESYNVQSLALPRELEEGLQDKYVKQALFDVFQGWSEKEPFLPSISPPLQPQPKKLCCLKKKLAAPIPAAEYAARHRRLYETLVQLDKEAFVMEGGATMRYYSNIDWELTERPFLVVLRRQESLPTGINMTIITPTFEFTKAAERFKEARLPKEIQPTFVSWDEHKSPFEPIKSIVQEGSLLVEPTTRLFIFQGLEEEHLNVQIAPISIRQLRMIKSPSELNILRCANTVTEMAIRAVRPHVKVGMSEQELQVIMTKALTAAGLSQTWVLALIDQHAALPHGDSSEKQVKEDSVILIDTGGELFGYQSDTTRTFFLGQKGFNQTVEDAWYLVKKAQKSVLDHLKAGMTAAQVDLTARHVIENGGYGSYFTHRLGHGIGLEMHEEPYMNKGNTDLVLRPGMTFSVEPGIYIVNEFGIRLEDIVVVNEQGQLELLTNGLAQDPWSL